MRMENFKKKEIVNAESQKEQNRMKEEKKITPLEIQNIRNHNCATSVGKGTLQDTCANSNISISY